MGGAEWFRGPNDGWRMAPPSEVLYYPRDGRWTDTPARSHRSPGTPDLSRCQINGFGRETRPFLAQYRCTATDLNSDSSREMTDRNTEKY